MSNDGNKKLSDLFCGCGGLSTDATKSSILEELKTLLSECDSIDKKISNNNVQPQINIKFNFTNCNFNKCNIGLTKSADVQNNKKPKILELFSKVTEMIKFIRSIFGSDSKSDDDNDICSNLVFA